jgi:hypothetical protein
MSVAIALLSFLVDGMRIKIKEIKGSGEEIKGSGECNRKQKLKH